MKLRKSFFAKMRSGAVLVFCVGNGILISICLKRIPGDMQFERGIRRRMLYAE